MKARVGTSSYWAPEIANETWIGPEVDMWAYGIVLHEMAVAYKPVIQANGAITFNGKHWKNRDPCLMDLIIKCLKPDPSNRITA